VRWRYYPSWRGLIGWAGVWVVGLIAANWQKIRPFKREPFPPPLPRVSLHTVDSLLLLNVPGLSRYRIERFLRVRAELGPIRSWEEVEILLDSAATAYLQSSLVEDFPPDTFSVQNLNALDSADLVALGICRPGAAGRVIRYRYKVRGFSDWAQVDSLRGLLAIERYRLRRYTMLGGVPAAFAQASKTRPAYPILDLNTASAEDLERLPGIGPKTAERIVRYREKLGYFVSLDQLREVWGLREENLNRALPYLRVESRGRPLSLRTASVEELAAHPYISWKLAKSLIRYRRQWGEEPIPVEVWREWLPDTLRNRLEPYLTGE
jgi:competence ComEA-like helix-hairpin-helix protein